MTENSKQDGSPEADGHSSDVSLELEELLDSLRREVASSETLVEQIKTLREQTQSYREQAHSLLSEVTSSHTEITNQTNTIRQALPEATQILTSSQETSGAIKQIKKEAEHQLNTVETFVNRLDNAQQLTDAYETEIEAKREQYGQLVDEINRLLPGATSAGLATAFAKQKNRFFIPKIIAVVVFVICIAALIAIAAYGDGNIFSTRTAPTLSQIGAYLLRRLPLALPVIWLALYAMRQHNLNERLEEDYAYKETIASAFQGFKQQMGEVDGEESGATSAILADNVIKTISLSPGRLYDTKPQDVTPLNSAVESMSQLLDKLTELKKSSEDEDTRKLITEVMTALRKFTIPFS